MAAPIRTSIVILTRNQLAYTRQCVEGIRRHTTSYELVFVDNGSTDGTVDYLRDLDGATVIANDRNLGFGGGCNLGIAAARGERVLLLNNDVVVTAGWLDALHRVLDGDPAIGIAGPRSNRVAGIQQVPAVDYDVDGLEGLDEWAATWTRQHAGEVLPVARLIGLCMLVRRRVIDRIGGFDLRYALGNFEDDDLCLRAAVAGFGCAIAGDSFVHHFGSRTFLGEGIDYRATLAANLRRFVDAWGIRPAEIDLRTGIYSSAGAVERTSFDPARHYAPLVGVPDAGGRVALDVDGRDVLAVCCDDTDPVGTRESLDAGLRWAREHGGTLLVRIDPRDSRSPIELDAAADALGDVALPDVVVVASDAADDWAVLRSATWVMVHGRCGAARAAASRFVGSTPVTLADLADHARAA